MPNNRGGIPMYNENPQYNATISSQLPQGSPASFGTQVAKEMAGMGDAIGKWGSNLVEYAIKQQEKEDDNYIMRRENDMRKALNDLMYNPQTGLVNQKLHNAKGATVTFDDEVEKLTQQFMMDVNNPNLQAKFQQRVGQWIPSYRTTVAKHEGDETFTAMKTDNDTNMQDKIDFHMKNPSGQSAAALLNDLQQNKEYLVNTMGLSPVAADEVIQEKYSNAIMQMVEGLAKTSDTFNIMGIYDAVKDKVTGDVYTKIGAMVGVAKSQDKAKQIAQVYYKDPTMWSTGVVGQGVFLKNKAMKAAQEDLTETEQVWVADEGTPDLSNFSEREIEVWGAAQFASQRIKEKSGVDIPPDWIYRQWAKESTYQGIRFNSPLARENNNFGGLTQTTPNGEANKQPDGNNYYREYGSLQDYAKSYVDDFILLYDGLENVKSLEGYSHFLKSNGYYGADEGEYTASLVNMTDVPSGSGHYESRTKDNRILLQALAGEFDTMGASSQDNYNQTKEYYKKQLASDPAIAAGTASPATIKAKMSALGMDDLPIDMQREIYNSVSFTLSVNQAQEQVDDRAKAKAYQKAEEDCYNWIYNTIANGGKVTAEAFKEQNFPMNPKNKLSILQHLEQAEESNDPYAGWYKGDNQFAFENAVSSMKKKNNLDDMFVPNIRSAITAANAERKKNGQPPMDSGDIERFVAGQSMHWKVDGRLWGYNSSEQPRAALQPGQYVSDDGRTVYDAEDTPLVWDDDMQMYRRPK